jgi:hypothetical protein
MVGFELAVTSFAFEIQELLGRLAFCLARLTAHQQSQQVQRWRVLKVEIKNNRQQEKKLDRDCNVRHCKLHIQIHSETKNGRISPQKSGESSRTATKQQPRETELIVMLIDFHAFFRNCGFNQIMIRKIPKIIYTSRDTCPDQMH